MKNLNKIICLAIFPVIAFTTSCNGRAKKINFVDAYDYVLKNYDKNEFKYIGADFSLKSNTFSLNGTTETIEGYGKESHPFNHNFSNLNLVAKDLCGICMTTEALSKIQYYYTSYFGDSISSVTGVKVNLDYYLSNGGLNLVLSTTNFDNLITLAQSVYSIAQAIGIETIWGFLSGFEQDAPEWVVNIFDTFTFSPDSKGDGKLKLSVSTDSDGFINHASLTANLAYTLGVGKLKEVEEDEKILTSYTIFDGSLDLDLSLDVLFK